MALVLKDRVKQAAAAPGTGTITLGSTPTGFQSFASVGNGNTTYFAIVDSASGDWEVNYGTYTSSGTTLSRNATPLSSSTGSLVNFTGAVDVFVTYPSENAVWRDTSGVVAQQSFGAITATSAALTSGTITAAPTNATDIVNKEYADSIASGLNYHQPVNYASTAALATYVYNNGASGVGATITAVANGALSLGGGSPTATQRVLVKDEIGGNAPYNGIYVVTQAGTSILPFILTRATDYDTSGTGTNEIDAGDYVLVISGTLASTAWVQQTPLPVTVGTTALTFLQFNAPITYYAGTGLNLSPATTFNISTTGVSATTYGSASAVPVIAVNAQGQITSAATTTIAITGSQVSGAISGQAGSVANSLTAGTYLTGTAFNGSAAQTWTVDATSANTASKVVARDVSGNFAAGTITATLSGAATSATTATNLAGGAANQIPYQTAAGTTSFITAASGTNTVLNFNGSAFTWAAGTISGIPLGSNLNSLTAGTYLTGTAYNGSAAQTFAVDATSANTASKVVARDASGNFSAGTITAALSGNATTATTANNVSGTVATANGGTGLTSFTSGGVVYASSTSALATGSALTFDGTTLTSTQVSAFSSNAIFNQTASSGGVAAIKVQSNTASIDLMSGGVTYATNYMGADEAGLITQGADGMRFNIGGSYARWTFVGTEAMRLTSTGLGIGTSSPQGTLDVAATGATVNQYLTGGVGNNLVTGIFRIGSGSGRGASIQGFRGASSNVHSLDFYTYNSADVFGMRLDATGLGIGTSSPTVKLDVVGTSGTEQFRIGNTIGGTDFGITVTENNSTIINSAEGATGRGIQFQSGGTNTMLLDSSGNLGLGVTPSAWGTSEYRAVQVGNGASFYGRFAAGDEDKAGVSSNAYNNGTNWVYIATDSAANYTQIGGGHYWYTAASGTAATNITFTQAMTLESGNLGVGATSPGAKLDVKQSGANWYDGARIIRSTTDNQRLVLGNTSGASWIASVDAAGGSNNAMLFGRSTDGTTFSESARFDTSGNLGIGTNSPVYQTQIYGSGQTTAALTDAGNKGGSLLLNTATVSAGDGGALLIGAGGSGAKPFAAIKGLLVDGGTNTTGSLAFSTRNAIADTALTERMRLDSAGNLLVGGTAARGTTVGTKHLDLFDGTAPAGTLTNGVSLYSSSGDLKFMNAAGTGFDVGYRNIPQNAQTGSYTLLAADSGKHIYHASGAGAATYTIPANGSVAYEIGTAISFINLSATAVSIAITTDTMYLSSAGTTGTRTLAQYGTATAVKVTSTAWIISGSGLT